MASFKKLDNGKWQVSFYCKDYLGTNKKYKKMGFDTKREAKEYSDNFIALHTGSSDTLFIDIFYEFLKYKKPTLRNNSLKTYETFRKTYETHLGKIKISDIDIKVLSIFFNKYINKPVQQKRIYENLKMIFKYATNYYNLKNNPFDNFELISKKADKKEKIILTLDEFKNFNTYIRENCSIKTVLYFNLLYFTGARSGEISALMLKDIDLIKGTININKTRISSNEYNPPKTVSSNRIVSIPSFIMEDLKKYISTLPNIPDLFLFSVTAQYKRYLQILRKANKLKKDISLHSFRHSHASYLINKGVDIATISKRLGHANPNITLSTYSHFYKQANDKIIDLLNDLDI